MIRKMQRGIFGLLAAVAAANAAIIVDLNNGAGELPSTVFTYDTLTTAPTFNGGVLDAGAAEYETTLSEAPLAGFFTMTLGAHDAVAISNALSWTLTTVNINTGSGSWGVANIDGGYLYANDAMSFNFNLSELTLAAGQSVVFSVKTRQAGNHFNLFQRTGLNSATRVESWTTTGDEWSSEFVVTSAGGYSEFLLQNEVGGSWSGLAEFSVDIIGSVADTNAPTPNPATWASPPAALGSSSIIMTATTGTDAGGIEYFFQSAPGNPPGGTASGWQSSPTYIDSGLDALSTYNYYVMMRDTAGNTGAWSVQAGATTLSSPFPEDWPDADNDGIPDVNDPDMDGDGMLDTWELRYFDSLTHSDGNVDSDLDGQSDYYEFLAGSDPTDPESFGEVFGILDTQTLTSSNTVTLRWSANNKTRLGATYHINYSTNLTSWRTLSDNEYRVVSQEDLGDGINRVMLKIDEMDNAQGFFSISTYPLENPDFLRNDVSYIDQIRKEIAEAPVITSEEEFLSRRAALTAWFRLLLHRGLDMSSFKAITSTVLFADSADPGDWDSLTAGYEALESILANPEFVPEVVGTEVSTNTNKTDWPMYMSTDGSNTGFSPDQGPATGNIAWRFPKYYNWYVRPVIRNGRIYVASPGANVFGFCLDEATGDVLWRARQYGLSLYETRGSFNDPVVSPDRVFLRLGRSGTDFTFRDIETGEEIINPVGSGIHCMVYSYVTSWIRAIDAESGAFIAQFNMNSAAANEPVLIDDLVYAASVDGRIHCRRRVGSSLSEEWIRTLPAEPAGGFGAEGEHVCIGTTDNRIFALDKGDGSISMEWQCLDEDDHARQFLSTPRESNGRVYVGGATGKLYCLDIATESMVWEFETGSWIRSRPLVIGSTVYVADLDGTLYAVEDMGDHPQVAWSAKLNSHGFTADLVGGSNGILAAGKNLVLYSVLPENGKVQWQHGIIDGTWIDGTFYASGWVPGFMTSPTVVSNVMYVGGTDGFVNAVDADTGEEIWRTEIGGYLLSAAPVIAEGKVFIAETLYDGKLFALDKDTGSPVWTKDEYGGLWVSPVYQDGKIFFGGINGKMYGADASDGSMLWSYDTALDKDIGDTKNIGIYSVPCMDSTNVYVGSWSGYYYSFNQSTGALNWKTKTKGDGDGGRPDSAAVMIHKDYLYVQKLGSQIVALNKNTGALTSSWVSPGGYMQNGTVAAHGDRVFGSAAMGVTRIQGNAIIYGFNDVENGGISTPLWSYVGGGGLTAPVTTTNKLIFGSSTDVFVTCLDPETGAVKWRTYTGGEMLENVPAIYGNKVFVRGKNGWIFAIE